MYYILYIIYIYIYIYIYIIYIYKGCLLAVRDDIKHFPISCNFPVMSTLLLEIVILYFGKQGLFLKIVLGCRRCGCQCS